MKLSLGEEKVMMARAKTILQKKIVNEPGRRVARALASAQCPCINNRSPSTEGKYYQENQRQGRRPSIEETCHLSEDQQNSPSLLEFVEDRWTKSHQLIVVIKELTGRDLPWYTAGKEVTMMLRRGADTAIKERITKGLVIA